MSDIVELLKGSSATSCRRDACMSGGQMCPHDDEEIIDSLESACEKAAEEIERLERMVAHLMKVQEQAENASVEIRRLREAIRMMVRLDKHADPDVYKIAREALGDE